VTADELAGRLGWTMGYAQGVLDLLVADGQAVVDEGDYRLAPAMESYRMASRGLVQIEGHGTSWLQPIVFRHDDPDKQDLAA
jgi:hypothetical protein